MPTIDGSRWDDSLAERGFVGWAPRLGELQKIYFELDGVTALDCYVLEPGRVAVGDRAEPLDCWTLPPPKSEAASARASR